MRDAADCRRRVLFVKLGLQHVPPVPLEPGLFEQIKWLLTSPMVRRPDEADPRNESISYVSPVARALIGRAAGHIVLAGDHEIKILSIDSGGIAESRRR